MNLYGEKKGSVFRGRLLCKAISGYAREPVTKVKKI
jgi:hypothetical protein